MKYQACDTAETEPRKDVRILSYRKMQELRCFQIISPCMSGVLILQGEAGDNYQIKIQG